MPTRDHRGRLHSFNDQPALVSIRSIAWYWHGMRHRDCDDQPAHIGMNARVWCRYDEYHRVKGAALEVDDGYRLWYLFGCEVTRRWHRRIVTFVARWRRRKQRRMQQFHLVRKGRWVP